ncbi:hypothetical protein [Mesorhizobium sp. M0091]|uniref:hypothetical protein n=1 Tax=Mesorhizobium sp. M0091 TaxID=2956875 RepID=UPI003339E2F1
MYESAIRGTWLAAFAYAFMSTRGVDAVSISEYTHKSYADAKALGIRREEIDEEVDGIYRTLGDAVVHFDAGLTK